MDFNRIPIEYQDRTDEELADLLPLLTVDAILLADVTSSLRNKGLLEPNALAQDGFSGPIISLMRNPEAPAQARAGLGLFVGYIKDNTASVINTDSEQWARRANRVVKGLMALGLFTQQDCDDFYALGGGRPWRFATVESIAAARAVRDEQVAEGERVKKFRRDRTKVIDGIIGPATNTDHKTLAAAWRNAADELEALEGVG